MANDPQILLKSLFLEVTISKLTNTLSVFMLGKVFLRRVACSHRIRFPCSELSENLAD